jgi:hypothetical protein
MKFEGFVAVNMSMLVFWFCDAVWTSSYVSEKDTVSFFKTETLVSYSSPHGVTAQKTKIDMRNVTFFLHDTCQLTVSVCLVVIASVSG